MRKYYVLFLGVCLLAIGCQGERRSTPTTGDVDAIEESIVEVVPEETVASPAVLPYFVYFDEQVEQMEIERDPTFSEESLHVDSLTLLFRMHYPEVPLSVIGQEGSTLNLEISDPTFLTQQMGSSGAKTYLVEVTYAFTEIPGIEQVHIQFEEGDHAVPGIYNRESFKNDNILLRN